MKYSPPPPGMEHWNSDFHAISANKYANSFHLIGEREEEASDSPHPATGVSPTHHPVHQGHLFLRRAKIFAPRHNLLNIAATQKSIDITG